MRNRSRLLNALMSLCLLLASIPVHVQAASSQRPVELGEEPASGAVEDSRLDTPSAALPVARQTSPRRRDVYRGYVFNPFRDRVNVIDTSAYSALGQNGRRSYVTIVTDTVWYSETVVLHNLVVTNSATLALSGQTSISAANVTVAEGAAISVDGQGYGSQQGPGAGTYSWDAGAGGGGHGGMGGIGGRGVSGGDAYGSVYEPVTLGSGGGYRYDHVDCGGGGGGAVHLVVHDTLWMDGVLSADGADGAAGGRGCGGGSGGSMWVEASTITGTGTIQANGGDGSGTTWLAGGGGGGRVAIYANAEAFDGTIRARGGSGHEYGGPGTVYLANAVGQGILEVDNGGHDGASAGLVAGTYAFDEIALTGYGHLTVFSPTSVLTLSNDTLVGDGTARLVVEGVIAAPSLFNVAGATLAVQGDLAGVTSLTIADVGGLELYAHTPYRTGVYTFTEVTVGTGTTLTLRSHHDGDAMYDDDYGVTLRAANVTVAEGAVILADGLGYGSDSGPGTGETTSAGNGSGGAGHGGWGGGSSVSGGAPYGSVYAPISLGSGGASRGSAPGGTGGGSVRLVVSQTLTLEGTISANGLDGNESYGGSGGGAGGSIWIQAGTILSDGIVRANGGNGGVSRWYADGGGGAGGRIAIYAGTDTFGGTIQVTGGTGEEHGEPGTVYLDAVDPLSSTVTAAPTAGLVADGIETATITVTLLTGGGYPVPGREVSLEFTAGTGNWIDGAPVTGTQIRIGASNAEGVVTATLASTKAEVKTVLAWAEDVRLLQPVTLTFVAGPPDATESQVWASPTEVAADGVTTATVHARVYDAHRNPVPGATVTLTDTGAGTTLTQPAEPTGADGRTWGAIRGTLPEDVTIAAVADGVAIVDTAEATFVGADLRVRKDGTGEQLPGNPLTLYFCGFWSRFCKNGMLYTSVFAKAANRTANWRES